MLRTVLTIAAALSLATAPALGQPATQASGWQVIVTGPGVAMLASTPSGAPNAKKLQTLAVFEPAPSAGVDRAVTDWVVDCDAETVNNTAGVGSLRGVVKPNAWQSATGGVAIKPAAGSIHRMILDYACTGARPSEDDTVLTSADDAAAYGRKLATQ